MSKTASVPCHAQNEQRESDDGAPAIRLSSRNAKLKNMSLFPQTEKQKARSGKPERAFLIWLL
ncbi:hypothetical protein ADP73_16125 [Serratia plymuthica]|nr:hypothetical protein ADP73_16125 [Serratia plymuthica]